MEHRLLIAKEPLFCIFWGWRIRSFLSQKVNGNMIFTDYWEVFVLNFLEMGDTVFFKTKIWCKDDICWLLKGSCFQIFGDRKYGLFFSQKVDVKTIFTWSFWAFHDIPGPLKYGFSCSVIIMTSWQTDIILHILDNHSWYYPNLIIGAHYLYLISWILLLLWKTKKIWFISIHKCHRKNHHNPAKTIAISTKIGT